MRELVIKHLNRNYHFSLSTMVSFFIKEKASGKQISLYGVIDIMKLVFDISHEEAYEIFDEWAEVQHTFINNRIVDLRYELYSKGIDIEPNVNDINRTLIDEYEVMG
jgi:hypothetical protein